MTDRLETFFRYFPCSEAYRDWGFYVLSSGYSKIPPHHPYPPVVHPDHHHFSWDQGRVLDSFTFVYILRGKGVLESDVTGTIPIVEGNLFIVFPHVRHRYKPNPATGWDEYWIEFAGKAAENFIKNSPLRSDEPVLTVQHSLKITNLFLDIIDISQRQPHGFEYLLSAQAFSLLTAMVAESDTQNDEDREKAEAVRKARQLLLSDLDQTIDLKQLAMELGMSYSLFRKTFKNMTGFSPHQYRLNFRLHRAGQLLKSSSLQVSQIAEMLGFGSIYYFSELFKKKTGNSPIEYRTAHNKRR
jgi:AraC-like DNA-binding protein